MGFSYFMNKVNNIFREYTQAVIERGSVPIQKVRYNGSVHNFERYLAGDKQDDIYLYWDYRNCEEDYVTAPVMFWYEEGSRRIEFVFPGCIDEGVDVNYENIISDVLVILNAYEVREVALLGSGYGGDFTSIIKSIPKVDTVELINFDTHNMENVTTELDIDCNTIYVGEHYYTSVSNAVIKQYPSKDDTEVKSVFGSAISKMSGGSV